MRVDKSLVKQEAKFYRRLLLNWNISKLILGFIFIPFVIFIFYLIKIFPLIDLTGVAVVLSFISAQYILDDQSEKPPQTVNVIKDKQEGGE